MRVCHPYLNLSVCDSDGLTVVVQPRLQIVERMLPCVTAGSMLPGVQRGSGSLPWSW